MDEKAQVIVAQDLPNNAIDALQLDPMVGQIKANPGRQARGRRQFLLRDLSNVNGQWSLICAVQNLLKRAKAQRGG